MEEIIRHSVQAVIRERKFLQDLLGVRIIDGGIRYHNTPGNNAQYEIHVSNGLEKMADELGLEIFTPVDYDERPLAGYKAVRIGDIILFQIDLQEVEKEQCIR